MTTVITDTEQTKQAKTITPTQGKALGELQQTAEAHANAKAIQEYRHQGPDSSRSDSMLSGKNGRSLLFSGDKHKHAC